MKRIFLGLMAIFAVSSVFSQRGKVVASNAFIDNGDLKAARARIDEAKMHPSTKGWPKTYIVAARLATEEFKKTKENERLLDAADLYLEAIALDLKGDDKGRNKGRFANEIKMSVTLFVPTLQNTGIEAFNKDDFTFSMNAFERVAKLNGSAIFQIPGKPAIVDSVFIYYTALSALRSNNWAKAEEYFKKSLDLRYGEGDAILLLHELYVSSNDSAKISDNLKNGVNLFPEDERILMQLINYYLSTGQNKEALEYLEAAIVKYPTNHSYYFVRGFLHENSNDKIKAEADYLKAIELKPDYYEPLISLGVIYFNRGAEAVRKAQDIFDLKKYEAAMEATLYYFRQALPYVERADAAKPDQLHVVETLMSLYYRLGMMDKYDAAHEREKAIKKALGK